VKILLQGSYNSTSYQWGNATKENIQDCNKNRKFRNFCCVKSPWHRRNTI